MNLRRSFRKFLRDASARLLDKDSRDAPAHPPVRIRPKKILFLGGSNTVMTGGYTEPLLASLSDQMGAFEKVTNLSAGANSSVHGLMIAKGIPDLADYDLIFVEYGVNDVKMARRATMPMWSAAAEGLLRFLLANRPERPIVHIQLARRDMRPSRLGPAKGIQKLVAHYGETHNVSVVEIDHVLRNVLFPDPEAFKQLYSDSAHYARPLVTTLVGSQVAAEVLRTNFRREVAGIQPPPLNPRHFEKALLIRFAPNLATADRVFSNSRFTVPTRHLALGESLELDLPGNLICLEYVTTKNAGTLRVAEAGAEPFTIHTRHKHNGVDKLPFMIKSTPLSWKSWTKAQAGPRRLRLTALADADPNSLKVEYNMIAAAAEANGGVFLSGFMCLP